MKKFIKDNNINIISDVPFQGEDWTEVHFPTDENGEMYQAYILDENNEYIRDDTVCDADLAEIQEKENFEVLHDKLMSKLAKLHLTDKESKEYEAGKKWKL